MVESQPVAKPGARPAALITGAATGIGRAAAVALAAAGYDVAINYSRSEQAARETAAQRRPKARRHCCSNATSAMTRPCAKCSQPSSRNSGASTLS